MTDTLLAKCPMPAASDNHRNGPDHGTRLDRPRAVRLMVSAQVAHADDKTQRRFLEFFAATIRNKNTRLAYY